MLLAENREINNKESTVNYTKEEIILYNYIGFIGLGFS